MKPASRITPPRCGRRAEIAKRTNNRYTVEVFPASTLGKETDINQGLTLGTVDIIYTGQLFAGRTYGPLAIGGAPFMFRDFNHWKAFSTSPLFAELAEGYRQKSGGHKVLAITYYGERHVTSNKAINKPEDMKGLKIRVPDAPLYTMFPRAVGANPTPIAFAEVYLGAAKRHRRRAGEPAADDRREKVLRSAEVHRADRPHHRRAADDRRRADLEQAVGRRQERSSRRC